MVTELVERYRERAAVLPGRCLSYGEGITYWALAEMIRRAAEIGEDDSPEERRAKLARALAGADDAEVVARHLLQLVGLELGGEPSERSAWAVWRLLETVAQRRPVIVVFDDLHWAEPVLLDLIVEVASTVEGPVLCVCMARFELLEQRGEWERESPTTIALRPLRVPTPAPSSSSSWATRSRGVPRPPGRARRRQPAVRRAGAAHAHRRGPA